MRLVPFDTARLCLRLLLLLIVLPELSGQAGGQIALPVESPGFRGTIHDNVSNQARQGSGLAPLRHASFPTRNLFRDDAVGMNFEHIFNGAARQREISMFTPRQDECRLTRLQEERFQLYWPAEKSQWGLESWMTYDFSVDSQVDLQFECRPHKDVYPQKFVAMMWASYLHSAVDRRIHFWGATDDHVGWVSFGEDDGNNIEVGTVSHRESTELPHEPGAQTLNQFTHTRKKFLAPFYYGLLDGDQNPATTDDRLLFLVLFDQTTSIRFAMWNFFTDERGQPDTHSPAWDWQYVVVDPQVGERYGYRTRVVVKPYRGRAQVVREYRRWKRERNLTLPAIPDSAMAD